MKLNISTGAALAALAAALAFTASPAAAQSDRHDHNGWQQRSGDSGQRGHGQEQRAERAAPPQRTYTPQSGGQERAYNAQAQQAQRGWAQQARQQQQRGWGGQARQQEQRTYTPQVREQQRSWAGTPQRAERNGTYVDRNRNTTYRNGYNPTYRSAQNGSRQWDRSWRNNSQYDWQRYRSANRNVFRGGNYYAPYRGYSYRRLNIGFYLDPLFYGQDYWIGDPGYYRLPDVYGPYRWVRYYDDALLVDIYSGEVVDVIYDFFW